MKFSKLQASGNDFILLDAEAVESKFLRDSIPALAQSICRRRFGIGADGLILVGKSGVASLKMRIFNPDGSEAEACGNGLRCAAKYAIEQGICKPLRHPESHFLPNSSSVFALTIETSSGTRQAKANMSENEVRQVEVSMGKPQFQPDQIPIALTQTLSLEGRGKGGGEAKQSPILNYPVVVKGRKLTLSLLSLGNPHAVVFLSQSVAKFPLDRIGPEVEKHPMFPKRTNFEIARVLDKGKIEARVWERGVGETLACGSGACAIAVAAQLLGYVGNSVDIIFPGGTLVISWDAVGEVLLNGPVKEVFIGEWQYNKRD
ncbi:MAG: diaminopimelate epimerase [Chloroflexota bacterium]|nr:diaminopimelate epimerase [Chloroflexota bacterium]